MHIRFFASIRVLVKLLVNNYSVSAALCVSVFQTSILLPAIAQAVSMEEFLRNCGLEHLTSLFNGMLHVVIYIHFCVYLILSYILRRYGVKVGVFTVYSSCKLTPRYGRQYGYR